MKLLPINTDYITLAAALKYANAVSTGGEAKNVIKDGLVVVNGELCLQRGKKLHKGDKISYDGGRYVIAEVRPKT